MVVARKILDFFLSVRTTVWLLLALLCLLLYGSLIMPSEEAFQALHFMPLLEWLQKSPSEITWWLWGSIAVLAILTANTFLCSVEAVMKKRGSREWLLIVSAQVIHAGFLFILLAHLLSSYGSFKATTFVYRDTVLQLPNGLAVAFDRINAYIDPSGYVADWSADIRYFREGREIGRDVIVPNGPSFRDGLGIYLKTVKMEPVPSALIEVSREPGALWALVGSILFIVGIVTLLILKIRREDALGYG
jgi:hypothetical protein